MRCHECKGTYRTRKGTLRMPDDVGLLMIPDVEYLECDECGGQMYPLATAKKIGDTRDRTISERLGSGWIRVKALIENHVDRKKTVRIPNLLVDTGSQHTWLPETVLEKIGVRREKKVVPFVMTNGTRVTRSVGFVKESEPVTNCDHPIEHEAEELEVAICDLKLETRHQEPDLSRW